MQRCLFFLRYSMLSAIEDFSSPPPFKQLWDHQSLRWTIFPLLLSHLAQPSRSTTGRHDDVDLHCNESRDGGEPSTAVAGWGSSSPAGQESGSTTSPLSSPSSSGAPGSAFVAAGHDPAYPERLKCDPPPLPWEPGLDIMAHSRSPHPRGSL